MEAKKMAKSGGKSGIFVILGGLVWVFCTSAFGAASFQGLGDLPGGAYESYAYSVSGDGSVVVGQGSSAWGGEAFRWTAEGGMVSLGSTSSSSAQGVSGDGSVVVGYHYPSFREGFRWTADSGIVSLGCLPGAHKSDAIGVSADGSVVVGVSSASSTVGEAFRWTSGGGMVGLGYLPGGSSWSSASGVSADGSVVVGYSKSASGDEAFRWTTGSGMVGLGDLTGGVFASYAYAVSADGSVVVGQGSSASGREAFRWTSASGMVGLGDLAGGEFKSNALAVSADGSIVVGSSSSALNSYSGEAFYWTESGSMQSLKDVLINLGADLTAWDGTTWTLTAATGISADGETIVGYGSNGGNPEAWIATISKQTEPVACVVGGDRVVKVGDDCQARVTLDGSCSSDADSTEGTNDDINDFDWYEVIDACDPNSDIYIGSGEVIECNLGLGEHLIILEVTDKAGEFDSNEVVITVEDVTPPEFSLAVEPNILWPPNHKMVKITTSWEVSDNCDEQPEVSLVGVTSSEDDDSRGDGHTSKDIRIGDDGSIYLRAERSGKGTGRVYTITYQAVDDSGNAAEASATVTVRHRKGPRRLGTGLVRWPGRKMYHRGVQRRRVRE